MAPPTHLPQTRVAAFDRLESLTDPAALSTVVGAISNVERVSGSEAPSGFSNSRHESIRITLRDGSRIRLRLKRMHIGEDWLARRAREDPPGREVSLLSEPSLAAVWACFTRAHLAYAVEGSEVGLLMEDLTDSFPPDVREPIPVDTEDALLDAIAAMHARFWESPALELPWLAKPEWCCDFLGPLQAGDEAALRGAPQSIRNGVTNGWREALQLLPAEAGAKLTQSADRLWLAWSDLPKTLIHGDTKVANFAFVENRGVAAFDWSRLGAAPCTVDLGWYLAVNSTRLARGKDELIARYRELLESKLGRTLDGALWERMVEAGVVSGARMLLWSKALARQDGTASRLADWDWWAARLARWGAK